MRSYRGAEATEALIKNVQNNLLQFDFLIDDKVVSFDYITKPFELHQANVSRFVPKLTKGHVEMNNFKKMNVQLATQVLSHSVASGICAYIALNQMSSEANPTADFVERINGVRGIHKWKDIGEITKQHVGSEKHKNVVVSWTNKQ